MPAFHDARTSSATPFIGACRHAAILAQIDPTNDRIIQKVAKRCNTSSFETCEPCARLWHGDALRIGLDGLKHANATYIRITLTLPAAGRFHFRDKDGTKRCHCGRLHGEGDPLLGTPLGRVDYDLLVRQNAALPQLWARTTERLAREVKRLHPDAKLDSFATVEPHLSLVGHVHAIFRIDKPLGENGLRKETLERDLRKVLGTTVIQRKLGTREAESYQWGTRLDLTLVSDPLADTSIVYLLKSVGRPARPLSDQQRQHRDRVDRAARQLARERYLLGEITKSVMHRHERKSEAGGYTGHSLLKSNGWSEFNFTKLRAKRRAHASRNRTAHQSCTTSAAIWRYIGKATKLSFQELEWSGQLPPREVLARWEPDPKACLYLYSLFPHTPGFGAVLPVRTVTTQPEIRSRSPLSASV